MAQIVDKKRVLIQIAGPTGIGKSSLAMSLAKKYGASIFSADSRQMYREMTIGTAKPSPAEQAEVPHYFVDSHSVDDPISVGDYFAEMQTFLKEYFQEHSIGIMVGGTGLYFKAINEGIDEFPDVSEEVHLQLEKDFKEQGLTALAQELKEQDPTYASKIDLENSRRVLRALAVIRQSGRAFSSFLDQRNYQPDFETIPIVLEMDREQLYNRINDRVDAMVANGLVKEVEALLPKRALKSLQTVGYQEFFRYFDGELSLEDAKALVKRNSRRYAKRQMTWFRNQGQWNYFQAENHEGIQSFVQKELDRIQAFK